MAPTTATTAPPTPGRRSTRGNGCPTPGTRPGRRCPAWSSGRARSPDPRGAALPRRLLVEEADPEAEQLRLVRRGLDDREAEVQRDRHGPEHRHHDAGAHAGRHAVVLDLDAALDRAGVHE